VKRTAKDKRIVDFFSNDSDEVSLCLIVPKPVGYVIEQMFRSGLWGRNIPEVCERVLSAWMIANLEHLAHLGIKLEIES
jgi:hypothetical protein